MSERNKILAALVSAAKRDDRHEINTLVQANPDLDWAEMFRLACVDAIQQQAFPAAVLLNRAWENRIRRGNIKSIRAAGVELSLREATDEQLLAEVRRRELMR
ncbi:hypothetical protein BH765_gp92 [Gordonia phage Kvothe]|uniref:Uncharacterized protein n=1 Tax=Gordonia phage Kvothe TaxID=1838071 RepID=A0A160DGT3_9CAUD|nr:hypothetical protein BH765_gp92 [Gordonia phage Kvothe]ANA86154.1 hypothetical protein PBI_KVOTHE_92 [Gordonia phage Kvothe]